MKISEKQIKRLVETLILEWKKQGAVDVKVPDEQIIRRGVELVIEDFRREADLDKEVHKMLDDLERSSSEEFQRYKMFPKLKKKLAEEKGIIL